jgi:hypothetical protein
MVAATVLPLIAATPAHATGRECRQYIYDRGYVVGEDVISGCGQTGISGYQRCVSILWNTGVRQEHALVACNRR